MPDFADNQISLIQYIIGACLSYERGLDNAVQLTCEQQQQQEQQHGTVRPAELLRLTRNVYLGSHNVLSSYWYVLKIGLGTG